MTPVDEFWQRKFDEADRSGGSVDVRLGDIPKVPRVAFALPSDRVHRGRKITIEGHGQLVTESSDDVVVTVTIGPLREASS